VASLSYTSINAEKEFKASMYWPKTKMVFSSANWGYIKGLL